LVSENIRAAFAMLEGESRFGHSHQNGCAVGATATPINNGKRQEKYGGAEEDRTPDLRIAKAIFSSAHSMSYQ